MSFRKSPSIILIIPTFILPLLFISSCGEDDRQRPDVIIEKPTPVNVEVQVPDEIAVRQPVRVIPVALNAGGVEMIIQGVEWGRGSVWGMERLWIYGQLVNHTDKDLRFKDVFIKLDGRDVGAYIVMMPRVLKPGNSYYFHVASRDVSYSIVATYDIEFIFE